MVLIHSKRVCIVTFNQLKTYSNQLRMAFSMKHLHFGGNLKFKTYSYPPVIESSKYTQQVQS